MRKQLYPSRANGDGDAVPVILSLSGGASSEWQFWAIVHGVVPRPPIVAAAFADTGLEHPWTYRRIAWLEVQLAAHGIPLLRSWREQSLGEHLLQMREWSSEREGRLDQPPVWIAKGQGRGKAQHRCTREFKVAPMRRVITQWLRRNGLPKRCVKWIGYGRDELHRAQKTVAKQDVAWETLDFPAIRYGRTRAQQREDVERWAGSVPRFSMCEICPAKSPARWRATPPEDLPGCYAFDEMLRDADVIGLTDGPAYLSDRLIPVRSLIERGDPQPALPGLEEYCDGGACFL